MKAKYIKPRAARHYYRRTGDEPIKTYKVTLRRHYSSWRGSAETWTEEYRGELETMLQMYDYQEVEVLRILELPE